MTSGLITTYLGQGTAAARPASPSVPATGIAFYWATDTDVLSVWAESAWNTVGGGSYTDEQAEDAVGGILTDTATIDFTYNDGANTITADVKDGSITLAKIVDATTTKRVIGRNTAAGGDFEEVTIEQLFSWISGSPAQGDVFYRDASGVARLAAGTSGQVLTTGGAAANPAWATPGGSAWASAGTGQTATGVYDFAVDGAKANVDFVGLASFNEIEIIARGVSYTVSGSRTVQVSVDNGSTWFTASGDYVTVDNTGVETAATGITLHNTAATAARTTVLHIMNTKGTHKLTRRQATDANVLFVGSASDINAIRFTNSGGGNTGAGTVRLRAR